VSAGYQPVMPPFRGTTLRQGYLSNWFLTGLYKYVFPPIWVFFVGRIVLELFRNPGGSLSVSGRDIEWLVLALFLVLTFWLLLLSVRLRFVRADGDYLNANSLWTRLRIHRSALEGADRLRGVPMAVIRVRYRASHRVSKSVWFMPTFDNAGEIVDENLISDLNAWSERGSTD
jgi:hypothetical protein